MSLLRASYCHQVSLKNCPPSDLHTDGQNCPPWQPKKIFRVQSSWRTMLYHPSIETKQQSAFALKGLNSELHGLQVAIIGGKFGIQWSSVSGSRVVPQPEVARITLKRKGSTPSASWITTSHIASNAFTFGTAAVLPFYTLMVLAPNADVTKRSVNSSIPYVVLGVLYSYLLYLSWTPETLRLMFSSEYWLPELAGITRMFSNELTVASAWIHLLGVDLFAARQVFQDGVKNKIETRHSVSLCLFFCPVGIMSHVITKALTKMANQSH